VAAGDLSVVALLVGVVVVLVVAVAVVVVLLGRAIL